MHKTIHQVFPSLRFHPPVGKVPAMFTATITTRDGDVRQGSGRTVESAKKALGLLMTGVPAQALCPWTYDLAQAVPLATGVVTRLSLVHICRKEE